MTVKHLASHWLHKASCSSPHFVPCQAHASSTPPMPPPDSLFDLWRKSRSTIPREGRSYSLGAQRPLNRETLSLATRMAQLCAPQMSAIFWSLHPWRALLTVVFGFLRGLLPVFKGYSHALIIDEVGSSDVSHMSGPPTAPLTSLSDSSSHRVYRHRHYVVPPSSSSKHRGPATGCRTRLGHVRVRRLTPVGSGRC